MDQVLKLAENYVMQRVISNHAPLTHTNKAMVIASCVGASTVFIALGFILFGTYQWLSVTYAAYETSLLFGGILFVTAMIIFTLIAFAMHVRNKKIHRSQERMRGEILLNLKLAEQEFKDLNLLENHPKMCLAAASLVGFILTEKAR